MAVVIKAFFRNFLKRTLADKKRLLYCAVAVGFVFVCVAAYLCMAFGGFNDLRGDSFSSARLSFILFSLAAVLGIGVICLLSGLKNIKLHVLGFVAIIVASTVSMFVFTPHSIPDEVVHFQSAYYYSNILSFNGDANGEDGFFDMRADDYEFCKNASHIVSPESHRFVRDNLSLTCKNPQMVKTDRDAIRSKPLSYLPAGLGIAIARLLGLGSVLTYYMGRFFNILVSAGLVCLAIKITPYGKKALLAISLLPMTTQLFGSYSYDNFSITTVILMFAYMLSLMAGKTKVGIKQLLILSFLIALAVPYKVVYIAVAALVLLIPRDNFKWPKLHLWLKIMLGVICLAAIYLSQFTKIGAVVGSDLTNNAEEGYSVGYLLANPLKTVMLFARTFVGSGYKYAFGIFGGYGGWFQSTAPVFAIIPSAVLLITAFVGDKGEPFALRPAARWYSAAMFAAVVFLTMLTLLLDWTPRSATGIVGVQGRYFIPALPALFLALRTQKSPFYRINEKSFVVLLLVANLTALCFHAVILLSENESISAVLRYFDFALTPALAAAMILSLRRHKKSVLLKEKEQLL